MVGKIKKERERNDRKKREIQEGVEDRLRRTGRRKNVIDLISFLRSRFTYL